ncbi:MAG: hypothetical protein U9P72_06745 [Campylobacterota bacterium]|nr:hypothetical protein [Campylobacterota bacterium]
MKKQICKIENEILINIFDDEKVDGIEKQNLLDKLKVIIKNGSEDNINIDYADLRCVVDCGEESSILNIETDIKSLHKQIVDNDIFKPKVKGVLLNFKINSDMALIELAGVVDILNDSIDEDATVIFGIIIDEDIQKNSVDILAVISY